MKILAMLYSIICYFIGVIALVSLILFIGDIILPVTINNASVLSPELGQVSAIIVNIILIALWGMQHSIMADPRFKTVWTKVVPTAIERSTFCLCVAIATGLLIACWSPIPFVIWDFTGTTIGTILLVGYLFGWVMTLFASHLINHFHLFGLQQAYNQLTQTEAPKITFVTPLLYKIVRHPMMTGILFALWCTPSMTGGRLLIAVVMTLYIIIGTKHEEETLVEELGDEYEKYRETTPMFIPKVTGK